MTLDISDRLGEAATPFKIDPTLSHAGVMDHALVHGPSGLTDEDLLVLMIGAGARDPRAAAQALLAEFGSLAMVACTPQLRLSQVVGSEAALKIGLVREAAARVMAEPIKKGEVIANYAALRQYLRFTMSRHPVEFVRVLYLNNSQHLLRDESLGDGDIAFAHFYVRQVVKRALELGAKAIILSHCHPGLSPTPSRQDIDMTTRLRDAAKLFDIRVDDHILVAGDELVSMKSLGLF